jgi:hypothetical protein
VGVFLNGTFAMLQHCSFINGWEKFPVINGWEKFYGTSDASR